MTSCLASWAEGKWKLDPEVDEKILCKKEKYIEEN